MWGPPNRRQPGPGRIHAILLRVSYVLSITTKKAKVSDFCFRKFDAALVGVLEGETFPRSGLCERLDYAGGGNQ